MITSLHRHFSDRRTASVLLAAALAATAFSQVRDVLDPLLREPYTDVDEWRDTPVRHRYVHGGFKGTEARFSIYFPPKERYEGRFFQHLQPVVSVKANGGARAEVAAGQAVTLSAVIEVPPQTGRVVAAEWSLEGTGGYSAVELSGSGAVGERVTLQATHTFSKPGTYFPALRATSQRQGDARTPYARIQNLGRVRVVVK